MHNVDNETRCGLHGSDLERCSQVVQRREVDVVLRLVLCQRTVSRLRAIDFVEPLHGSHIHNGEKAIGIGDGYRILILLPLDTFEQIQSTEYVLSGRSNVPESKLISPEHQ